MSPNRMSSDSFTYWVERRIREASLKDRVRELSIDKKNDEGEMQTIHGSFMMLFKSGMRAA